ncbi:DNA topoisomerase IB [Cellvibrio mixtus]|uniref:DNA topoisomerase IB n=1 Tax=Cellvibrio mixtus TaxID=39650 RepID=UPI000586BD7D|nr:DNA topoisomerase IB [Cellvibrio mixtus]
MQVSSNPIKIPAKKIIAALNDPQKSAQAINLVYVQDSQAGISRIKRGNGFCYYLGKKELRNKAILDRIKKLVIPPAWKNVWICQHENGHLQATGVDTLNRKQYRYHNLWNSFRNTTKFYRLYDFGKTVPAIRQQVKKDLEKPGLPVEKVLAAVVYLMEQTSIRVGNSSYEKLYGSVGLTTLKDKHTTINGDHIRFVFKGKKGVAHNISLKNKKLARIIKQCRDIPGKELFQYYDEDGNHKAIDSGMVNDYLKSITGKDFTTKDFRTWIGTVKALGAFQALAVAETKTQLKQNIINVLDEVAAHLGNTRAVCKKYYVHPVILELCESNKLHEYFSKSTNIKKSLGKLRLMQEEKLLLHIIEQQQPSVSVHR